MKAKGNIEISFESGESAESAAASLEAGTGFGRARLAIVQEERNLKITINADDVVAFRAAANGVLRNLQVFEDIGKKFE